jgi:hypothetical protein
LALIKDHRRAERCISAQYQYTVKQQQAEIDKINQLIAKDHEIVELRLKQKMQQKHNWKTVITANDYLREVNAEDQARQMLIVHQLQLIQAQINYQTTKGK